MTHERSTTIDSKPAESATGEVLHSLSADALQTAWQVFQFWTASRDADRFRAAFHGYYPDRADFGAELLAGIGAHARLERLPPWLQDYVRFDHDAVIRDFVAVGHFYVHDVTEGPAPGCYVFDGYA